MEFSLNFRHITVAFSSLHDRECVAAPGEPAADPAAGGQLALRPQVRLDGDAQHASHLRARAPGRNRGHGGLVRPLRGADQPGVRSVHEDRMVQGRKTHHSE